MQQESILRDLGVRSDQVFELWNTLSERHTHTYVCMCVCVCVCVYIYIYIYIYLNYGVTFFFDFRRVSYLADRPLLSLHQF